MLWPHFSEIFSKYLNDDDNMKLAFTSIYSGDIGDNLRDAVVVLEKHLGTALEGRNYGAGIDVIAIAIVAYSADNQENLIFSRNYEGFGTFVHPIAGANLKGINIPIPISPNLILSHSCDSIIKIICSALISCLMGKKFPLPKDFDFIFFRNNVIPLIEIIFASNFYTDQI